MHRVRQRDDTIPRSTTPCPRFATRGLGHRRPVRCRSAIAIDVRSVGARCARPSPFAFPANPESQLSPLPLGAPSPRLPGDRRNPANVGATGMCCASQPVRAPRTRTACSPNSASAPQHSPITSQPRSETGVRQTIPEGPTFHAPSTKRWFSLHDPCAMNPASLQYLWAKGLDPFSWNQH